VATKDPIDPPARTPHTASRAYIWAIALLVDPWPLAKATINMIVQPRKWEDVSLPMNMLACGRNSHKQQPQQHIALKAVQDVLADLETRVIEFLSEWLVALLMPAKHVFSSVAADFALRLGPDSERSGQINCKRYETS